MSETIQFLAMAGHTGTSVPFASHRSSADLQLTERVIGVDLALTGLKSRNRGV